jgi:hypothetical protein
MGEPVLNPETKEVFKQEEVAAPVAKAYLPPDTRSVGEVTDFAAQFPDPLDTTEIINMCEELSLWKSLPEVQTGLKTYTWREMDVLEFVSGTHYIAFTDGSCPEEYDHDGDNLHVHLKNIGAKKSLTVSDIMHSMASISAGYGIKKLVAPYDSSEGMPGGNDIGSFYADQITDLKRKEVILASTLVLNGWDRLLVNGDATNHALEFDGVESWATNRSCTFHTNSNSASGTFSASTFDRFLGEACVAPQTIAGNPAAIQEMMSAYFAIGGAAAPQTINFNDGNRIVPGFNFASYVNTARGRMTVIADNNFRKTQITSGSYQADLWALRMSHNGEPLVFKITQIPLSLKDLVPGCTAISFELWAKTALVIKQCCAQNKFVGQFTGYIASTCSVIGTKEAA